MNCYSITINGEKKEFKDKDAAMKFISDNKSLVRDLKMIDSDGRVRYDVYGNNELAELDAISKYSRNLDEIASAYDRASDYFKSNTEAIDDTWQDDLMKMSFSKDSYLQEGDANKTKITTKNGVVKHDPQMTKAWFSGTETIDEAHIELSKKHPNLTIGDIISFIEENPHKKTKKDEYSEKLKARFNEIKGGNIKSIDKYKRNPSVMPGFNKSQTRQMDTTPFTQSVDAIFNRAIDLIYNEGLDNAKAISAIYAHLEEVSSDSENERSFEAKEILGSWDSMNDILHAKLENFGVKESSDEDIVIESKQTFDTKSQGEAKFETVKTRLIPLLVGIESNSDNAYSVAVSAKATYNFYEVFTKAQGLLSGKTFESIDGVVKELYDTKESWAKQLGDKLRNASEQRQNLFMDAISLEKTNAETAKVYEEDARLNPVIMKANQQEAVRSVMNGFKEGLSQVATSTKDVWELNEPFKNILKELKKKIGDDIKLFNLKMSEKAINESITENIKDIPATEIQFALRSIGVVVPIELCNKDYFKVASIVALDKLEEHFKKGIKTANPYNSVEAEMRGLAKMIINFNKNTYDTSFKSGEKTMASNIRGNYERKFFNTLKSFSTGVNNTSPFLAKLITDPMAKGASLLSSITETQLGGIRETEDGVVVKPIKLDQVEIGISSLGAFDYGDKKGRNKELSDLSSPERFMYRVTLFLANRNDKGKTEKEKSTFVMPGLPGSTTHHLVTLPFDGRIQTSDGALTSASVNHLFKTIVSPEIDRMIQSKANVANLKDGTSAKDRAKAGLYFLYMPELNDVTFEDGTRMVVNNGTTITKENRAVAEQILLRIFKENLQKATNDCLSRIVSDGIISENNGVYSYKNKDGQLAKILDQKYGKKDANTQIKNFAAEYTASYMRFNSDMYKTVLFDVSKVITPKVFSRLQEKITSGESISDIIAEKVWVQADARLKGAIAPSNKGGFARNKSVRYIIAEDIMHGDIKTTDGQEYCTLSEYLHEALRYGDVTGKLYDAITKRIEESKGEDYTYEDLQKAANEAGVGSEFKSLIFSPMKQVGFGMDVKDNERQFDYYKMSTQPMLPWIIKGSELDKARKYMEKRGIDRLAFESVTKIHSGEIYKLYNANGEFSQVFGEPHVIPRDFVGKQQESAYHKKNEVTRVTQLTKNFLDGVYGITDFMYKKKARSGKQLNEIHIGLQKEMYALKEKQLLNNIGGKKIGDRIIIAKDEMWKLRERFLKEALSDNGTYDIQVVDFIRNEANLSALMYASNADKLNYIISSLVRNDVLNYKMNGNQYVATSSAALGKINLNNYDGDIRWLKQKVKTEDGNVVFKDNDVIVPWMFDGTMEEYEAKGHSVSDLASELTELFANRIPNQGLNSQAKLNIIGFAPKHSNSIIVASNLIEQMGMDFDFDKLFCFIKNTKTETDGRLSVGFKTDEQKIQNDLMDVYLAVHNNEEAQPKIKQKLGYGGMLTFADKYRKLLSKNTNYGFLTSEYTDNNIEKGAGQKQAVGVFAVLGSLASVLTKRAGGITIELKNAKPVVIGGFKGDGTVFSKMETTERIKDVLSVALDDAKNNAGYLVGISPQNYNAMSYFLATNMDENLRSMFFNHPAVIEFNKLRDKYTDKEALDEFKKRHKSGVSDENRRNLTEEGIKKAIETGFVNHGEYIAAVEAYVQAEKYGQKIQALTKFISVDSKGAPVEMVDASIMEYEYDRVTDPDSEYIGLDEAFKNSVVDANINYGLRNHNAIASNFSFINAPVFSKILDKIKAYTDFRTDKEEVSERMIKAMKLFIMQSDGVFGEDFNERRIESFSELKDEYNNARDNQGWWLNEEAPNLMASLKAEVDSEGNITGFKLNKGTATTFVFNDVIAKELYNLAESDRNSKVNRGMKFINSIIDYSITSGRINDYNSIYRHIPYKVLMNNDRIVKYKNITESNAYDLQSIVKDDAVFEKMFVLNNQELLKKLKPKEVLGLSHKDPNEFTVTGDFKGRTFVTMKLKGKDVLFKLTSSAVEPETKKVYYKYQRVNQDIAQNDYSTENSIKTDVNQSTTGSSAIKLGLTTEGLEVGDLIDNMLNDDNVNEYYKKLLKVFQGTKALKGLTIRTANIDGKSEYTPGNHSISINLANNIDASELHTNIMHEIVHALTVGGEKSNPKAFKKLQSIFDKLSNEYQDGLSAEDKIKFEELKKKELLVQEGKRQTFTDRDIEMRPYANMYEFLAISTTDFGMVKMLSEMDSMDASRKGTDKKSTFDSIREFFNELVNYLSEVLGVKRNSVLTDVIYNIYNTAEAYKSSEDRDSRFLSAQSKVDIDKAMTSLLESYGVDTKNYNGNVVNMIPRGVDKVGLMKNIMDTNANIIGDTKIVLGIAQNQYYLATKKCKSLAEKISIISDEMLKIAKEC